MRPAPGKMVAAMRELAGPTGPGSRSDGSDGSPDPAAGEPTCAAEERFAGRPPRSALGWVVPAAAVSAALTVSPTYYDGFGSERLALAGFVALVCCLRQLLVLLLGRTQADGVGLRNRLVVGHKMMPWSQVRRLEVVPSLFGRRVVVAGPDPNRYALAAPREGLLARRRQFDADLDTLVAAAARPLTVTSRTRWRRVSYLLVPLLFVLVLIWSEKPWLEPWWPARHEATSLPRACAVADHAAARRLVATPVLAERWHGDNYFHSSYCRWSEGGQWWGLAVTYDLRPRNGDDGGTEQAAAELASSGPLGGGEAMTGLGDQAYRRIIAKGRVYGVELEIRRANMIVKVWYAARSPAGPVRAEAEALARRALSRIRLE
jgi:hypothetical protein